MGAGLLKDAVLRSLRLSQEMGIRAMLCHGINEDAKRFYLHHGFVEPPSEPLTVMLNLLKMLTIDGSVGARSKWPRRVGGAALSCP